MVFHVSGVLWGAKSGSKMGSKSHVELHEAYVELHKAYVEPHEAYVEPHKAYVEPHEAYVVSHQAKYTDMLGTQGARNLPEPARTTSRQSTKTV